MTAIEDLVDRNATRAGTGPAGPLPSPPSLHVAVVAGMDARIDPVQLLGLRPGEAHVIRNAGGVVTDDVIRSLAVSRRKLGTTEVRKSVEQVRRSSFLANTTAVRGFVVDVETGDLAEVAPSQP